MMAAGLMSGLYTADSTYTCTGKWDGLGSDAVKFDWTVLFGVKPHGKIALTEALAFSCDPYFYEMALQLYQYDADYMSQVARQFGLGQRTGLEQIPEAEALIPDPDWKLTTYGEAWLPGDSVNMGIGQGFVLVTPLQIATMLAAVSNGGALYRPQLVHRIAPPGGAPTFEFTPQVNGHLPTTPEQLGLIQQGLREVTTLQGGTARFVFPNFEIPVLGKTGTAETPQGIPHAWFAGYTEANRPDKPDLAIVVMVENRGEGSEYAAPIFKRIVEIYFLGRAYSLYPWEQEFSELPTPTPTP
jgi:penicillin-binding protein 2